MSRIVVLCAHPRMEHSRVNRALMDAAARAGPAVSVRDVYALYPDYLIDVDAEQAALQAADLIVWQHPLHWYGMPALMKLWLDEVFAFGWAYGPGGRALAGKDLWLAVSTGGAAEAYRPEGHNRHVFDDFLPPYAQTAALAGMRFLPPLVLHGAHRLGDDALADHARVYAGRLSSYPDWPDMKDVVPCTMPQVPAIDRPTDGD